LPIDGTAAEREGAVVLNEITEVLNAIDRGDAKAADQLLPLVYDELRKLAARRLAEEHPGQTLQPTALVHEAYLRVVGANDKQRWDHRGHFFAAAAEAMRRILIDNARRKQSIKHGGGRHRVVGDIVAPQPETSPEDLLALDEALDKLAIQDPAKAEMVKLRFFAGLTMPEIAEVMGISLTTAERRWTYVRTWLYAELEKMAPSSDR
jgi:RNA polymerase sigma factor (TIGR02999 family)